MLRLWDSDNKNVTLIYQRTYTNTNISVVFQSSGAFECEICKLRYQSARLLRTHTSAAHARFYKCNKCNHLSHTAHQASDHDRWHEGHTYRCQLCGQSFIKRTSYLTHVRKRHASEHVCEACGEGFVSGHGLTMHRSKAHSHTKQEVEEPSAPSARYCASCNIQFVTSRAWQRHVLTHNKHIEQAQLTNECPICSRRVIPISEHLKEHGRSLRILPPSAPPAPLKGEGAAIEPLPCDQCGRTFLSKGKLSAHTKRTHLGLKYNKNIVCELCGKRCTSNAALKYHQRTHTGERPYKCSSCTKRFSDKNQLRIHRRTHTGEKPYSCELCAKRFAQKPALNRHYRVHTGAKPYACSLCSKSFSQSNSLKGHVRSVHLKMPSNRRKGQHNPETPVAEKDAQNTSFVKSEELVLGQM